jgi:hypothetical protein
MPVPLEEEEEGSVISIKVSSSVETCQALIMLFMILYDSSIGLVLNPYLN